MLFFFFFVRDFRRVETRRTIYSTRCFETTHSETFWNNHPRYTLASHFPSALIPALHAEFGAYPEKQEFGGDNCSRNDLANGVRGLHISTVESVVRYPLENPEAPSIGCVSSQPQIFKSVSPHEPPSFSSNSQRRVSVIPFDLVR